MPLPALFLGGGLLARQMARRYGGRAIAAGSAGSLGFSLRGGRGKDPKKRRRRRARLTQSELMELTNIKNILGRTAAANALPYYLGRGR
jgi:hypothetical protein